MTKVVILGSGMAGLSSGWLLQRKGVEFTILEMKPYIGGLARSFEWHGFHCDFAAHRLFTYNEAILQELLSLVPMGRQVRRSRIYLRDHWMHDPLDIIELFNNLPLSERMKLLESYLFRPRKLAEINFENYVIKRYGRTLYQLFFQPYTEKLFGISGDEISVLWARQKVRLSSPLDHFRENTKTKFQYFYYPIQGGYGAIVNSLYRKVQDNTQLEARVIRLESEGGRIIRVVYEKDGVVQSLPADVVISTLPMSLTARLLGRQIDLRYQKVDAVYLWISKPNVTDYHWVYFMDYNIAINRMVEFKNMSPVDTPPNTSVLCAEVTQEHPDVIEKVVHDLVRIGLIRESDVLDTKVIREKFAYPVYNREHSQTVELATQFFSQFENIFLVGRAAEFRHREADDNLESAIQAIDQIAEKFPVQRVDIPLAPMNKDPLVYVIILTYNHIEDTLECLQSVFASKYPNYQVVVVDNGSSDGTPEKIRQAYPAVHVIANERNLGVPAGYNVGFQYALGMGAHYVFMLNNDTLLDGNTLDEIVKLAEQDPKAGIVMPKVLVYGSQDKVWSSGSYYRTFPPAIVLSDKNKRTIESVRLIEYAPSCGLLIHRRAFESAGLFDTGYFFLFDDWDFSARVRAHGLNIWYTPSAQMWHKVSQTTRVTFSSMYWYTWGASITRFYRRHGKPVWFSLPVHVGYIMLREFLLKWKWNNLPDFWRGVRDGLRKPLGKFPELNL